MTRHWPEVEVLSAYADGELAADRRAEVDAHLATCDRCRRWLAEWHDAQRSLRALADDSLGVDLSQVVRGRIEALPAAGRRSRTPRRTGWHWFVPAGIGAAACVSLGMALGLALTVPATLPRPLGGALEVFAPVAPGGLCAGAGSCRIASAEPSR